MAARSNFKISDEVRDVLARSIITATSVALPPETLERKLYEAVNKALEGAGGKWDRKSKTHVFTRDPREALSLAVETGQALNLRTKLQAFYTPPELAKQMATRAHLTPGMRVLEPSVGEGALVKAAHACAPRLMFYCVDNDEPTFMRFSKTWEGFVGASIQGHLADFLQVIPPTKPEQMFDVVLMNSPFTGGADMAHVTHAWEFLRPGGVLVALTSPAWKTATTKPAKAFRELLAINDAEVEDVPRKTFEHTDIATVLVVMHKPVVG